MGSSAQNSSGVHWCRRRVRPGSEEGSEGSGEGLRGFGAETSLVWPGSTGFRRSREGSRKHWCKAKFNRVPEKIPEKVPEKVGKGLVERQVTFNRDTEKVWEVLVQSQVRFNRVPEKVPGEGQVQQGFD